MKTLFITRFASLVVFSTLTLGVWQAMALDDLPYTSPSTGADGALTFREIPNGRNAAAMAYDAARGEMVLFGGNLNGGGLGDTWVFRGNNWIRLDPQNKPADRYGHHMVWDAARQQIVMFGGYRVTGRLNDTWTWNGTDWTLKQPASSPGPRDGYAMAYDGARQKTVIFGGNDGGTADETWLWDGTNWQLTSPATKAPSSSSSSMIYDEARQEIILWGNYGQTWIWNGTTWTRRFPQVEPPARGFPGLAYDTVRQEVVMFSGSYVRETWTWNGTTWTPETPVNSPLGRQYHAMAWHAGLQRVLMYGGDVSGYDSYDSDTWFWNGTDWSFFSGKIQYVTMGAADATGRNFTTINIPQYVTVRFIKNGLNYPVRWLATGDVTINGVIDVSGDFGSNALLPGVPAAGGPGGFDGGRGAIRFDASNTRVGQPGQGPGGGAPGTSPQTSPQNLRDGLPGGFAGVYGNSFLQPLQGGSGGGGGSSGDNYNGGNGGGGGGAILIASSRDIILNGVVRANGGASDWSNASYGGAGSGGGILLRADRISGAGSLEAYGGNSSNPNGRIRVESYVRTLTGGATPVAVIGLPTANADLNVVGTLTISSVKGQNVPQPPGGSLNSPDVVFTDAGPINVVVTGTGIPDGTQVKLRITTGSSVVDATPVAMTAGTATFNVTVPKGVGTFLATA
ncbi:MAG TPA: kelch repeat-containing protein, partial [Verrucomicrobiae bacterium]